MHGFGYIMRIGQVEDLAVEKIVHLKCHFRHAPVIFVIQRSKNEIAANMSPDGEW